MVATVNKTTTPKEKKAKKARPQFPGARPFKATPADFDFAKFRLTRKDFDSESAFLFYRADELEWKASQMRDKAELAAKVGGKKELATAKRLLKMQARFDELKAELEQSGLNVAEMLSVVKEKKAAKAKK